MGSKIIKKGKLLMIRPLILIMCILVIVACKRSITETNRTLQATIPSTPSTLSEPEESIVTSTQGIQPFASRVLTPTPNTTVMGIYTPASLPATPPVPPLDIVYVQRVDSSGKTRDEVWLTDTLSLSKQLLFSTDPGVSIHFKVLWHPIDKHLLYYLQRETDSQWAWWEFNLEQEEHQRITNYFNPKNGGVPGEWSASGEWVSMLVVDNSSNQENYYASIVNMSTGDAISNIGTTGETVWSPTIPDRLAYYDIRHSETEKSPTITIVDPATSSVTETISLPFFPVLSLSWSHEYLTIAGGDLASGNFLYHYRFETKSWDSGRPLSESFREIEWSPSGEWLVVTSRNKLCVLNKASLDDTPVCSPEMPETIGIIHWLEQPEQLIFVSGDKLWHLHPGAPAEAASFFDLSTVLDSIWPISFDLRQSE